MLAHVRKAMCLLLQCTLAMAPAVGAGPACCQTLQMFRRRQLEMSRHAGTKSLLDNDESLGVAVVERLMELLNVSVHPSRVAPHFSFMLLR